MNIAVILILFAQLDVDALTKAITDIGERLTKLERLLPKDDSDKLTPIPSGNGLQLLDSRGQAITEVTDGRQFRIVASAAGKWSFKTLSPDADVDVTESPSQLVCTLRNGAGLFVAHVTETGSDLTTIIVQCGHGPQPPPDDSKVTPRKPRKLFIAVVEDVRNRSPETATTLSDLEAWNAFRDRGHEWRFYDQSTQETRGLRAVGAAKTSTFDPPQIVIHDVSGAFVFAGQLPNMEGVNELVARLEAGK